MSRRARFVLGTLLILSWIAVYAFAQNYGSWRPFGVLGVLPLMAALWLFRSTGGKLQSPAHPKRRRELTSYVSQFEKTKGALKVGILTVARCFNSEYYSKVVMTVIAACLLYICWAIAEIRDGESVAVEVQNPVDVEIDTPLEVEVTNTPSVEVLNTVDVVGTVEIER